MLLVCYNAGYQVGKLTGLPSRRKGIMSMARYHYTRENENGVYSIWNRNRRKMRWMSSTMRLPLGSAETGT